MIELPAGWAWSTVGDVGDVMLGRQRSPKNHEGPHMRPYLRVKNVFEDRIDLSDVMEMNFTPAEFERYKLEPGDILLNEGQSPELIGRPAMYRGELPGACFTNSLIRFRPHDGIDREFALYVFRHYLHSGRFQREARITTNIAHLSGSRFAAIEFPVPPFAEQRRIVTAIEEQFSRLDVAEHTLSSARVRNGALRSSVLASAFSDSWPLVRVGDVASVGSGATPKRGRNDYWVDGTIPWVTSGQLNAPFVGEPTALVTEKALRETNIKVWPKHTLLVAMYGEGKTRGHCSELLMEATTNQACAAIVLQDPVVERSYLKLFFASSYDANRRLASGGVQPNLSLGLIKNLAFPLPPLDEQRRIVSEVERQLSLVEALGGVLARALRQTGALRRTILQYAFSGQLVPQDPAEEPAQLVLEQVAAKRVASAKRSGRRREVLA